MGRYVFYSPVYNCLFCGVDIREPDHEEFCEVIKTATVFKGFQGLFAGELTIKDFPQQPAWVDIEGVYDDDTGSGTESGEAAE